MIIKLSDGYEVEIRESVLKKWSFTKLLREADKNSLMIIDVAEAVLEEGELDKLEKHLDKDGDPDAEAMIEVIKEIMEAEELKNS